MFRIRYCLFLLILIVGSFTYDIQVINKGFSYSTNIKSVNIWEKVNDLEISDEGYAHTYNGSIYFIGKNGVQCYDPHENQWELINEHDLPREYFLQGGSTIIDNKIYIFYGWYQGWMYDIAENNFQKIVRTDNGRKCVAVAQLNGLIYVSGGTTLSDYFTLSSVYVYNPNTTNWSEVANMRVRRTGHEMVSLNGCIYSIGGNYVSFPPNENRSIEKFNPSTNTWHSMGDRSFFFNGFGATGVENSAFVVMSDNDTYVFNITTRKWAKGPSVLAIEKKGIHNVAVIYLNGTIYAICSQLQEDSKGITSSLYKWDISTHEFGTFEYPKTYGPRNLSDILQTLAIYMVIGLLAFTGFLILIMKIIYEIRRKIKNREFIKEDLISK